MAFTIALNGYGRIGRCVLRALYECGYRRQIRIAGINDIAGIDHIAHLTRYDSTHGRFNGTVSQDENELTVNDDPIRIFQEPDISKLPWAELGIDVVLECTGSFTSRHTAARHLESGARKVLFSCPAEPDVDATIVFGLNDKSLRKEDIIVSNASCTSNCIAHVIDTLDCSLGIESGMITTIHSMMNDQPVIDAYHHPDLRRTRSASTSIVPATTQLARGIDRLFPHLKGRFDAVAMRVPTVNVSVMQLTATVLKATCVGDVNRLFRDKAEGPLSQVLGFTLEPLVSCDFNHDPRSAVIDGTQTRVVSDRLVTLMAWFDNEWGYANRMLDTTLALMAADRSEA